jgi:hypothetical protein
VLQLLERELLHRIQVRHDHLEELFALRISLGVFVDEPGSLGDEDVDFLADLGRIDLLVDGRLDEGFARGVLGQVMRLHGGLVGAVHREGGRADGDHSEQ